MDQAQSICKLLGYHYPMVLRCYQLGTSPLFEKCIYNTQWLWPLLSHVHSAKSKREYRLEQSTLQMSSERLLFVADGHYHRDPHCSRCREQDTAKCLALNRTPISHALLPRFRGCYEKRGEERLQMWMTTMKECFIVTKEKLYIRTQKF